MKERDERTWKKGMESCVHPGGRVSVHILSGGTRWSQLNNLNSLAAVLYGSVMLLA